MSEEPKKPTGAGPARESPADRDKPARGESGGSGGGSARDSGRSARDSGGSARDSGGSARDSDGGSGRDSGRARDSGRGSARDRPVLTERQRIEARRKRMEQRRRRQRPQPGNALSRGVRATAHEAARTARFLARGVAAAFEATGPLGRRLAQLAGRMWAGLVALAGLLLGALAGLSGWVGTAIAWLDRVVTPRRAAVVAGILALAVLAGSQFTDFRATEIGQPGYGGIEDVITAPRVDVRTPMGTHSILLLVVGLVAAAGLYGAARSGNRRAALLLSAAGLATVAVSLAIDLPAGLDLKEAAIGYSGASAVLLSAFWMQLAAGVALAATGLLLMLTPAPRSGTARRKAPAPRPGPARGNAPGTPPDDVAASTRTRRNPGITASTAGGAS